MVKDRLQALRERSGLADGDDASQSSDNDTSLNVHFVKLTKKIEDVQNLIKEFERGIDALKTLHNNVFISVRQDADGRQKLEKLMNTLRQDMKSISDQCKAIDREVDTALEKHQIDSTECRMMRTMHWAMMTRFRNAWLELGKTETDYRVRCKARIKKTLEIVGQEFSDDQVEDILSQGKAGSLFNQYFSDSQEARLALHDIEERHRDLLLIEESLREVNALFQEVSILVELQGEKIERIESSVEKTTVVTDGANTQLKQARRMKKRYGKMKRFLIIGAVIVVVIGIVVLAIVLS